MKTPYAIPDFYTYDAQGNRKTKADLLGQYVVLYFYPKSLTPGCTQEALDFQRYLPEFQKLGCRVVGVSRDSPESQKKFKDKHAFLFELWSDKEGTLCDALAVWKEKSLFGKTFLGMERSTFLIDPKGMVRNEWRKVKVKGHAEAVLAKMQEHVAS